MGIFTHLTANVRGHKTIGRILNQMNPTNSQQFLIRFSLQGRRFAGSRKTGGAEIHQIWQNTKIDLEDVCARKGISGVTGGCPGVK